FVSVVEGEDHRVGRKRLPVEPVVEGDGPEAGSREGIQLGLELLGRDGELVGAARNGVMGEDGNLRPLAAGAEDEREGRPSHPRTRGTPRRARRSESTIPMART